MSDRVLELEAQVADLRRQLAAQAANNAERNRLLDALGICWCSGGGKGGMHRYNEEQVTAEHVAALLVNAARARQWFINRAFKLSNYDPAAAERARRAIEAALPADIEMRV